MTFSFIPYRVSKLTGKKLTRAGLTRERTNRWSKGGGLVDVQIWLQAEVKFRMGRGPLSPLIIFKNWMVVEKLSETFRTKISAPYPSLPKQPILPYIRYATYILFFKNTGLLWYLVKSFFWIAHRNLQRIETWWLNIKPFESQWLNDNLIKDVAEIREIFFL